MKPVIEAEKISKRYTIYHQGIGAGSTLVETLTNKAKRLLKPFTPKPPKPSFEEFWALQDCSFKIEEGDRLALIGKNGAGKSTLLKVLSRITEPTSGRIKIRGRVSSLLEVGTGFHPELTGRENIFLNGAILGMTSEEIKKKFDEIVSFADIEKFLDTPVKRYSSGMYARLGFSIAAHLDPDILIVDEVLAVGDSSFQEKCLKRLGELGKSGRTVLFVSHDISNVLNLCNKGIYLVKGRVESEGAIGPVVDQYLKQIKSESLSWKGNVGDEHIRFNFFGFRDEKEYFQQHETPELKLEYEVFKYDPDLYFGFIILNSRNQLVARADIADDPDEMKKFISPGRHTVSFPISASLFNKGDYSIRLECNVHNLKPVIIENPSLRFPVYPTKPNVRFAHLAERSGLVLGYRWKEDTHG